MACETEHPHDRLGAHAPYLADGVVVEATGELDPQCGRLDPREGQGAGALGVAAQGVHGVVNEHGAPEATSIGLNTIREICNRQPNAISDKELIRELTSYKNNHDKGVMMASRSIIALFAA